MDEASFAPPDPVVIQDPVGSSIPSVALGQANSSKQKKFSTIKVITGIIVVITLAIGGIFMQRARVSPPKPPVSPSPQVVLATPTPERQLSLVASQSAFIQLQLNVSSLTSNIQNVIVSDPSLAPPVLDLPLGFTN